MTILETVLIGIGLSMDASAVCISNGLVYPHLSKRAKWSMPLLFGLFQGLMPVFGFLLGTLCADMIRQYAQYVTFFILTFIGGKMILDTLHGKQNELPHAPHFTLGLLCLQAVATSIDAFAVGISFCATEVPLCLSASVIALTTFFCCFLALSAGRRLGQWLGAKASLLGGIILSLIGIKSLL